MSPGVACGIPVRLSLVSAKDSRSDTQGLELRAMRDPCTGIRQWVYVCLRPDNGYTAAQLLDNLTV